MSLAPLSSGEGELLGLVGSEGLRDGIGEAAFQDADRFSSAVAAGSSALEECLGWGIDPVKMLRPELARRASARFHVCARPPRSPRHFWRRELAHADCLATFQLGGVDSTS